MDTIEPRSKRNFGKFIDVSHGGIQAPESDLDESDGDADSNKNDKHNQSEDEEENF